MKKLFNLKEGIVYLKLGYKIRKVSWRKTFSWIEYSSQEKCILRYDLQGLKLSIYKDINLDNPGNLNNIQENVWELYDVNDS